MDDWNADESEGRRLVAALTIAGSDSGGNAGVQADLRAFHVFGIHGCTVFAALTAQNPFGVSAVVTPDAAFVAAQLDAVFDAYDIGALKTGMLATPAIIETVADRLVGLGRVPKVIDPVMVATSGAKLLQDDAIDMLKSRLLPLAALITPNLSEAEALTGRSVSTVEEMADAARGLYETYGCAALVKGGHGTGACADDVLFDGESLWRLSTPRVENPLSTHGTGCSLSAAIAASLACGHTLEEAVTAGKAYIYEAIRTAVAVGERAAVLGTPKRLPVECVTVAPMRA